MTRHVRGRTAHLAGAAAEDIVARRYAGVGADLQAMRWRGEAGEIDLIFELAGATVFVEVKKSGSFATAATRLGPHQVARLWQTAEEYLGTLPGTAPRDCRFDLALVDDRGHVEVLENAFA
ncbi:hypothetical protein DKT77_17385 [Meridianimarinicoccus roseus]|uniref:Uncharacterized protein n=1 Tax=Meridianimarinicoccus roseus TaxID=2072018 RepID=A0A2V2LDF5_9RHOB|nr:YraN family protein [Meridianimarinicoccus roseus]PWR01336.1 hypothetical protein DKT77_17385 [Meridianimarinicoccus roseus]